MVITQSNINPAIHFASSTICRSRHHLLRNCFSLPRAAAFGRSLTLNTSTARTRAFSTNDTQDEIIADAEKLPNKPPICTADELHYVSVNNSGWRLALWRYTPSPQAPPRKHPLLLLSGVGTNAIGYDLSPGSSFARYMCGQGFDTWILEVRGAGLSMHGSDTKDVEKSAHAMSEFMEAAVENALCYEFDKNGKFDAQVHGRLPYELLKPNLVLRNLLLSMPPATKSISTNISTNADEAHAAHVFSRLCLQDCFQGVMCFETLNPPMGLGPLSSIEGMNEVQTENVETKVLCKPSVQEMEAAIAIAIAIAIAKGDKKKTVITENLPS
ncbi:unnamed protein product [Fraxinus pennsylvanica]|uniref:Uncharacterized protein n=1 Tax=Fraxinus pennsylvanica TaxID=56036 RepID=A0AAD1YRQ0_9LAMI|nr:unnamed protein product [Fraxinus pennsylvanica]